METRLRSLEDFCAHLNKQVLVMKKSIETKLSDMQFHVEAQVDEIRKIVVQQDRIYRERIRRLDERIEQLSTLALRLARNTCATTVVGGLGLIEGLEAPPLVDFEKVFGDDDFAAAATSSASCLSALPNDSVSAADDVPIAKDVLRRHMAEIGETFDHFVGSRRHSDSRRRAMDLEVFGRLVKDLGLLGPDASGRGASPELLWMKVIQKVAPDEHPATAAHHGWELRPEQFAAALEVLAAEAAHRRPPGLLPGVQLELFLTEDLFPRAARTPQRRGAAEADPDGDAPVDLDAISDEYGSEAVGRLFHHRHAALRDRFRECVGRQQVKSRGFLLASFIDLLRAHGLLSFITKPTARRIFDGCVTRDRLGRSPSPSPGAKARGPQEAGLDFDGFVLALKAVAHVVYGGPECDSAYPTPASRVQKLLSKLLPT